MNLATQREIFKNQIHLSTSLQHFYSNTLNHLRQLSSVETFIKKELLNESTNFLFQTRVELTEIINNKVNKELAFKFNSIKEQIKTISPVLVYLSKTFEGKGEPLYEGLKVILKHISQMEVVTN